MSLKQKSVSGFVWSFVDNLGNQGVQFVIGIVLARLLTPKDYGIIGIITVFLAVSQSFIDSGFTQALIRKENVTQKDFSTVFFFNLAVGIGCYFLFFSLAQFISDFFNEPLLVDLLRVLGITLVINSIAIIQRANLTRQINFKLQSKISIAANVVSGAIGIILAYRGWGVWSLVWRNLSLSAFQTILLWIFNKWKPTFEFDRISFRNMFHFGSRLLVAGVVDKIYLNIYYFMIARFFSPAELGLYTRADQFKNLFSQNLNMTIQRVSYPVLASMQHDDVRLRLGYQKVLKLTMFLSSVLMLGMASVARPLVLLLLGEKWLGSVEYLQLLCLVGLFYPLHALNLNILNVKGRSDLFLKLEVLKKILVVPALLIGIYFGIKPMIIAMIGNSIIAYFLNSQYSGRLIQYPTIDQIKDVSGSILIATAVMTLLFTLSTSVKTSPLILLPVLLITGFVLIILIGEKLKIAEYQELKSIIFGRLKLRKSAYEN
jgi:O-antigen/teichoic acid export membrane protein